jgi:restriction endonuclease S subunit
MEGSGSSSPQEEYQRQIVEICVENEKLRKENEQLQKEIDSLKRDLQHSGWYDEKN